MQYYSMACVILYYNIIYYVMLGRGAGFRAAYAVSRAANPGSLCFKIPQREVQWKQGAVIYMMRCTSLSYNTTPIHCTPLRLHPPLPSIQCWGISLYLG